MKFKIYTRKISWPMVALAMMLQKSPVLRSLSLYPVSITPRIHHMLKAVVAAVTVGAYDSVTAATGQIGIAPGSTSTTVSVGEKIQIVFWVSGEKVGSPYKPELWEVLGTLPTGVQTSENRNAGTLSIVGNPTQAGEFSLTVKAYEKTSKKGGVDSYDLTITVMGSGPVFIQQPSPANQEIATGGTLNLSAAVDITSGTTYQWQRQTTGQVNYTNIPGENALTLSISNVTTADSGSYRLVATNNGASIQSNPATVTVTPPPGPVFTEQPLGQAVTWGGDLNLSAAVDITNGTTYQWQRLLSGEASYSDIPGATSTALSIAQMTISDSGAYRLVATNGGNAIQSNAAMITVEASAFQTWQESQFQDPFASVSGENGDPDMDSISNALEYPFGLDPNHPENEPFVQVSNELINNVSYLVWRYPPLADGIGATLLFEGNASLDPGGWSPLENGVNGIIIDSTPQNLVIKTTMTGPRFIRLKVVFN